MPERIPQLPPDEVAEREYVGRGGPASGSKAGEPSSASPHDLPTTGVQHDSHPVEWAHVEPKVRAKRKAEPFVYETEPEITDAVAEQIRREVRGTEIRLGLRRRRGSAPIDRKG